MPIRPTLLAEIQAALGTAMSPSLTTADRANDIFEAYVFGRLIEAAKAEGAVLAYQHVTPTASTTFTFRTSPGHIWSDARPYTHAVIMFPGKPLLEAHLGVYFAGGSKVAHEADFAVLTRDEAITCRHNQAIPRAASLVLGVECKFYTSSLWVGLARGFLGLCADFGGKDWFFVTNTEAQSTQQLLAYRRKNWEHRITPASQNDVGRLQALFQNVFKNFKNR